MIERRIACASALTLATDEGGPSGAPTVILLHGGGQTRHSWHGVTQELIERGYHVITYDARGHGDSDWPDEPDYSLAALAGDLKAVAADLSGPVALVGASMGGATSFYATGRRLFPIAALILVDIVLRPAPRGTERIIRFMTANPDGFASLEEAAAAVAAYNPHRPRSSDHSGLLRNLRLKPDGRLHWHWDPRLLDQARIVEPPRWSDQLVEVSSGVTVPTLLVRGGASDVVDDDGVAELLQLVPQMEVHEVAGAGHMVAGDRNDAFNVGILQFLDRYFGAGPVRD